MWYCDATCQKNHWKTHKHFCKILGSVPDSNPSRVSIPAGAVTIDVLELSLKEAINNPTKETTQEVSLFFIYSYCVVTQEALKHGQDDRIRVFRENLSKRCIYVMVNMPSNHWLVFIAGSLFCFLAPSIIPSFERAYTNFIKALDNALPHPDYTIGMVAPCPLLASQFVKLCATETTLSVVVEMALGFVRMCITQGSAQIKGDLIAVLVASPVALRWIFSYRYPSPMLPVYSANALMVLCTLCVYNSDGSQKNWPEMLMDGSSSSAVFTSPPDAVGYIVNAGGVEVFSEWLRTPCPEKTVSQTLSVILSRLVELPEACQVLERLGVCNTLQNIIINMNEAVGYRIFMAKMLGVILTQNCLTGDLPLLPPLCVSPRTVFYTFSTIFMVSPLFRPMCTSEELILFTGYHTGVFERYETQFKRMWNRQNSEAMFNPTPAKIMTMVQAMGLPKSTEQLMLTTLAAPIRGALDLTMKLSRIQDPFGDVTAPYFTYLATLCAAMKYEDLKNTDRLVMASIIRMLVCLSGHPSYELACHLIINEFGHLGKLVAEAGVVMEVVMRK